MEDQVIEAEARLRAAMLASDVEALNLLLSPELVFTNHLGRVLGKDEDLAAHRSGDLRIGALELSERSIRAAGDAAAVAVRARVSGAYAGEPFDADLRFTRVWARAPLGGLWVVAAHSCAAA